MIDSHLHLDRHEFAEDRPEVIARAVGTGVEGFLNVGYDLPSSRASVALAEQDPRILAAIGIHPHDASGLADADGALTAAGRDILAELRVLARSPRVVAIGEIGLDYYRDLSPRKAQHRAVTAQLELAADLDLPVVLHIRDAHDQMQSLLADVGLPPRGAVLHSFSGEVVHACWAREHGCLLGISGPVTYRGSRLPQILTTALVGADDVLLETDAPWLPPVPWRGRRNEPAFLSHTRDRLAALLAVSTAEITARTNANFRRLFGCLSGSTGGVGRR